MDLVWVVLGVVAVLIVYRLVRRGVYRARISRMPVGTYKEVQEMIRAGVPPLDIRPDTSRPSLDEVFGQEDDFAVANDLSLLLSDKWCLGREMTDAETLVFALTQLSGEVSNGGLHQYFFNSGGDFSREALSGLRRLELDDHADILEEAIGLVGGGAPSSRREDRWVQLDDLTEADERRLAELTREWFRIERNFEMHDHVGRFARAHRGEFS